jgi:hypothetical protein
MSRLKYSSIRAWTKQYREFAQGFLLKRKRKYEKKHSWTVYINNFNKIESLFPQGRVVYPQVHDNAKSCFHVKLESLGIVKP